MARKREEKRLMSNLYDCGGWNKVGSLCTLLRNNQDSFREATTKADPKIQILGFESWLTLAKFDYVLR